MNYLRRQRFDTRHRLVRGLGAIPQDDSSLEEPALLRRAKLLNQRVEARLALIVVVAIDSHIIPSRTEFAFVARARLVAQRELVVGALPGRECCAAVTTECEHNTKAAQAEARAGA